MTRTMAAELAPYNIRVLGYIPGLIDTALTKESQKINGEKLLEPIAERRYGNPDDVAKVIAFMASDLAEYMRMQTPQSLRDSSPFMGAFPT